LKQIFPEKEYINGIAFAVFPRVLESTVHLPTQSSTLLKMVIDFPVPSRDVTDQTENSPWWGLFPASVIPAAWDGKMAKLFYSVYAKQTFYLL